MIYIMQGTTGFIFRNSSIAQCLSQLLKSENNHHYRGKPMNVILLGQFNLVQIPKIHIFNMYFNIMNPSKPQFPQCSLTTQFIN